MKTIVLCGENPCRDVHVPEIRCNWLIKINTVLITIKFLSSEILDDTQQRSQLLIALKLRL
jgi:hypothetical protein